MGALDAKNIGKLALVHRAITLAKLATVKFKTVSFN